MMEMSETAKPTPTPWRIEEGTTLIWGDCTLAGDDAKERLGVPVAETFMARSNWQKGNPDGAATKANAALIVTAVNALEPMKAALEACLELIDDMSRFAGSMALEDYKLFNEAPLKARAALRLAEGEKE
jgi:hypothetical protein